MRDLEDGMQEEGASGDMPEGAGARQARGAAARGRVLAVDVGNTQTHLGLFEDGTLAGSRTLTTHTRLTADEVVMQARSALAFSLGRQQGRLAGSILSCVVPVLTDTWIQALAELAGARPLVVGPGIRTGLRMRYKDPSEVGSDRIADVVAAREAYGAPIVVVDLGTTTNIEVVDGKGAFLGGLIAPGLRLGAQALSAAAARLPMIEIRAPRQVIGQTTRDAMQAGVIFGEVARIDGLLDAVMAELGEDAPVVVTGDDARTMAALIRHDAAVDETLTLRGLELLWEMNARKRA